jgi:hypothetical protein
MRRCSFVLLVLAASTRAAGAQSYDIAVFGDMPYVDNEAERAIYLPKYKSVLDAISASNVQFAVHVGDYTTGPFCGDSTVSVRYAEFQSIAKPLVFVFGDNDWTDCARGGFDPLERLQKLRDVFAKGDVSLGQWGMKLTRQSRQFPENVQWSIGDVSYVALNLPGSRNNWGPDEHIPSAEYVARNAANLEFLRETFAIAQRENKRALGIFIQANPGLHGPLAIRGTDPARGYTAFLGELRRLTLAFGKPVVLFHGDTHYFRIDKPLFDDGNHVIPNFTRVETFGHPNYYWVRVHVDPADPDVFTFKLEGVH